MLNIDEDFSKYTDVLSALGQCFGYSTQTDNKAPKKRLQKCESFEGKYCKIPSYPRFDNMR